MTSWFLEGSAVSLTEGPTAVNESDLVRLDNSSETLSPPGDKVNRHYRCTKRLGRCFAGQGILKLCCEKSRIYCCRQNLRAIRKGSRFFMGFPLLELLADRRKFRT
jgi:hypothetical protein